jgi:uncharacterized NAD(P)/FAD-binding protein YdhS
MRRDGRIRRHRRVAGLDVDSDMHPIGADGRADERLWVLGPLCEGATFYNHLVPSPGTYSGPIHDANRCVAALFEHEQAEPKVHEQAS